MTENSFDVIVLGLGGIGSAVADQLALKGQKVLGLERFAALHDLGSSHGETRAIRKAYFEDPKYVPLMQRSYELWEDLERYSGELLLEKCGVVLVGPKDSPVLQGCLKASAAANLPYKFLSEQELIEEFKFNPNEGDHGFYEPDGGYLHIEKCIEASQNRAQANGAQLKFNCGLESWGLTEEGVEVAARLVSGDGAQEVRFTAKKLVLALGPWTSKFAPSLAKFLKPKRVAQFWFNSSSAQPPAVFFHDSGEGGLWYYGFPEINGRIKIAFHNHFWDCDPDQVIREVRDEEKEEIEKYIRGFLPGLGEMVASKTCMYTMTPDEHFVLGHLPHHDDKVVVAGGFSGHGYKFAPVVGSLVTDLVSGVRPLGIDFFDPARF